MTRLELTLLGGFQARLQPGGTLALSSRKAQALLAYLAVPPGQAHPRGKLAALLWGDTREEWARASLRQALFAIRRAAGDTGSAALVLEGDTLALDPSAVAVDVAVFERLMSSGDPAATEDAVSLYHGDFLAGLVVDGPAFEEWLVIERERLRELALVGLAKLLGHQRKAATPETAIRTALKVLALDPLQEPVHRTLMRLYSELGRRGAALRQYQHCVTVLQREIGLEPEAETKQLYQEILRQRPPSSVVPQTSRPTPEVAPVDATADRRLSVIPAAEGTLIGREASVKSLGSLLAATAAGPGMLVAIVGEAGIGKTRLMAELMAEAAGAGRRLLIGHAHESEQVLPFGPWVDALRSGRVVDDLVSLPPAWRAELSRLIPELGTPSPASSSGFADYLQLFESVAQAIGRLVIRQPLLLVLEDLHWADEMSVRLLAFLGRRLGGWPVLIAVTIREEELPDAPVLRRSLEELERAGHLARVALGPLSQADTLTLVRLHARAGSEATLARLAAQAWTVSEGNPLVVVEIIQAQAQGAAPFQERGLGLPERVRAIVGRRLERLSPRAQQLATVAAVIGRRFEFALLQRAARLEDEEAAAGVEELVRRRILHGIGDAFEFTHERIREVAYAALIGVRRRALHAAVGAALEHLHAGRLEAVYDRLAHHHVQADDGAKAVEYLTRFARTAARTYAHEEAVRAYGEALRQLERLPPPEADARLVDIVPRLTRSLMFLGRFEDARGLLLAQQPRVEQVGNPSLTGQYYLLLAHVYGFLGDRDRTVESARHAVGAAERAEDDTTLGKAFYILAMEGWWAGEPQRGIEHGRRAVALLERATERWWLGQAHFAVAANHVLHGDFVSALQAATQALAIGDALGDPRVQTPATWLTGTIYALRGDWAEGVAAGRRSLEYSSDPLNRADALGWLGLAYLEQGSFAEAIDVLDQSVEHWSRFRVRSVQGGFRILLGHAYLMRGDVDQAAKLAEEGFALTRETRYLLSLGWGERLLALIARTRGDQPAARALLQQALATFTAISAQFEAARTQLLLAEVCGALDDMGAAERALASARAGFTALKIPKYAHWTEALGAGARPPDDRLPRWA
ncbi:MAG TPA: BTAD domain-containing putative transcriptional regulator [Methylomirabilota bacterium]|jgi:DNA-binding SARP family transcriptional activator/tetratricopeptide (TPR) repeat protein